MQRSALMNPIRGRKLAIYISRDFNRRTMTNRACINLFNLIPDVDVDVAMDLSFPAGCPLRSRLMATAAANLHEVGAARGLGITNL